MTLPWPKRRTGIYEPFDRPRVAVHTGVLGRAGGEWHVGYVYAWMWDEDVFDWVWHVDVRFGLGGIHRRVWLESSIIDWWKEGDPEAEMVEAEPWPTTLT